MQLLISTIPLDQWNYRNHTDVAVSRFLLQLCKELNPECYLGTTYQFAGNELSNA